MDAIITNAQKHESKFFPRVVNTTDIQFIETEITLLRKCLKYNLQHKPRSLMRTLAWEVEAAVAQWPDQNQDYMRHRIAHTIEKLYKEQNTTHPARKT
jgi:hypothetical protein